MKKETLIEIRDKGGKILYKGYVEEHPFLFAHSWAKRNGVKIKTVEIFSNPFGLLKKGDVITIK